MRATQTFDRSRVVTWANGLTLARLASAPALAVALVPLGEDLSQSVRPVRVEIVVVDLDPGEGARDRPKQCSLNVTQTALGRDGRGDAPGDQDHLLNR